MFWVTVVLVESNELWLIYLDLRTHLISVELEFLAIQGVPSIVTIFSVTLTENPDPIIVIISPPTPPFWGVILVIFGKTTKL